MVRKPPVAGRLQRNYSSTTFDWTPGETEQTPSIERLDPFLVVPSTGAVSNAPACRYRGYDATESTWEPWVYGPTLTNQSTDPTALRVKTPLRGSTDRAVELAANAYYSAGSVDDLAVPGDSGIIVEVVAARRGGSRLVNTYDNSTAKSGFNISYAADSRVYWSIWDDGSNAYGSFTNGNDGLNTGAWYHTLAMWRPGEAVGTNATSILVNGSAVALNSPDATDNADPIDAWETVFSIGAATGSAGKHTGEILYIAVYTYTDFLSSGSDGITEWEAIGAERNARLTGIYPRLARGAATPTNKTRNSQALTKHGLTYTNYHTETPDLSGSWFIGTGDTMENATGPFGDTVKCAYVADGSDDGSHSIRDTVGVIGGNDWMFSVYAKAGAQKWFQIQDANSASLYAYFDLENGAVGTNSGWTYAEMIPLDNGWYRCWVARNYAFAGTNQRTYVYRIGNADLDGSFAGDGSTVSAYLWAPQAEIPNALDDGPSTYIYNSGSTPKTSPSVFAVGSDWMRISEDITGDHVGMLEEGSGTNVCEYSDDLTNAAWAKNDVTIADGYRAPDGSLTADAIMEGGTLDGEHYVSQNTSLTNAQTYIQSAYLKKGARKWCALYNAGVVAGKYFDLEAGEMGSNIGSVEKSWMENVGDGWYRCSVRFTSNATGGRPTRIYAANGDSDNGFDGEHQVSLYAWRSDVQIADAPPTPVYTEGASDTRAADDLQFDAEDNISSSGSGLGIMVSEDVGHYFDANDGASDRIVLWTGGHVASTFGANSSSTEWNLSGTEIIDDGEAHIVEAHWETDRIQIKADGELENTDTNATPPTDLSVIHVGQNYTGAGHINGILKRIQLKRNIRRKK